MALPEGRFAFPSRFRHAFDGVPGLISYLVFNSLERRAPVLARGADELGRRWRGRAWLVGQAETGQGPLDIAYLGSPDRVSRWLLDRLGAQALGIRAGRLAPGSVPCDVELVLVPAEEAQSYARAGWLMLPRYVHHRQLLDTPPSAFERRVGRRLEAAGIRMRVSHAPADLEQFQRELYDPMLERRHGDRALRTGRALLRFGQLQGGLMLAEVAGRPIAGAVGAPAAHARNELEIWALGVAADAPSGAGLAPVFGWVRWARERGFAAVDHVASVPLYSDGLTRQKLRWGTVLTAPAECRELVALRVHGNRAGLRSWLGGHTFAARSNAGLVPVKIDDPASLATRALALADQ